MTVVGKHFSRNSAGEITTTLHVSEKFDDYYKNSEAGRGCEGQKVETIYVGNYDCSGIKVGSLIEVFYDKAISTSKGTFQGIKKIDVLK